MKVAVIGAGQAGIEAAVAARKAGATAVTVYSREAFLPYVRARLPEIAFGSGDIGSIAIHPLEWYEQNGLTLRLDTPVTNIEVGDMLVVKTPDGDEMVDSLVFANGAGALKPVIPGLLASSAVYTLWSADDAKRLNSHIRRVRSIAILGGGVLGVESAMRARKAGLKVHLIEKQSRLMHLQLDAAPSAAVRAHLEGIGVKVYTDTTLESASQVASKVCLRLTGMQKTLDVDIVLLTVGSRANIALAQSAGLTCDRGIYVDETLQTTCPQIFAAGDCVQYGLQTRNSTAAAIMQGRIAGYNAVIATTSGQFMTCPSDEIPLHLKAVDLEIHSWGQTAESCMGAKIKRLDNGKTPGVVKLKVVRSDKVVVGVQMVGTGVGFDELVAQSPLEGKNRK